MNQIRNIIFDLGGVLLNLDVNKSLDAFRELGFTNIDEYFRIGHAASYFKEYEVGAISDQEFVAAIKAELSSAVSEEQIIEAWNAMLLDFPEHRLNWLKALPANYRIFLFSNTNGIHLESFKASFEKRYAFNMDELFEQAYYSHIVMIRKPDIASYLKVVDDHGLIKEETLFIDDALVNVEAAISAGIQGFHLTGGMDVTEVIDN